MVPSPAAECPAQPKLTYVDQNIGCLGNGRYNQYGHTREEPNLHDKVAGQTVE